MAVISKGQTFAAGDQVTASKLNNLADNATFASGAVDNVSTQLSGGAIVVKDGGVTTAKLNDNAVTTVKIADANVTTAKIADANVTTAKLNDGAITTPKIADANVTTAKIADANVTFAKLTDVIDDDTMATATDTTLATSESIKAYVNASKPSTVVSATKSAQSSTVDFTVSGYSLTGSSISESSGTITITGAGLWLVFIQSEYRTTGSDAWNLEIYQDGGLIESYSMTTIEKQLNLNNFINSSGSFNLRIFANELGNGSSGVVSNVSIKAVKLS